MVNAVLGGAVVGPWDVAQIDEVTLDAIRAMTGLAEMRAALDLVENRKAAIRAAHYQRVH